MTSTVMLAVTFDITKVNFPVEVSVKLDGVAADFYKTEHGWEVRSRQGKPLPSCAHLIKLLDTYCSNVRTGSHVIGELTVMGMDDFKDAGGIIRRKAVDERITLNVYDVYIEGRERETYNARLAHIEDILSGARNFNFLTSIGGVLNSSIRRVPVCGVAENEKELRQLMNGVEGLMNTSNLVEGFMVRCLFGADSYYNVGKRSRNMMRYKPKPSVDLEIVRFEEATANKDITFLGEQFTTGEGLQAVGRIVALYRGKEIGVGPGSLTHEERRTLWVRYSNAGKPNLKGTGMLAEIEYMRDDSYEALRQPVFKRWRPDKEEVSEET